jgi:hypothetical protein
MAWGDIVKPMINPVRKIHKYRSENTGKTNENGMGFAPSETVKL